MENTTKLYWLTRLDSFQGLCITLIILSAVVVGVYWLIYMIQADMEGEYWANDYRSKYSKKAKIATWVGAICLTLITLIPSRTELIFIVAGGKTMDFVEKDSSIQKIPAKTTEIIAKYLDAQIKEMENSEKK